MVALVHVLLHRRRAFAMIMRAQLSGPGLKLLHPEVYNQINVPARGGNGSWSSSGPFPVLAGISNTFVPIQIGARSMGFRA